MLLGIGLHASLSFFPAPWPVQDGQQAGWLGIGFSMVHGFRMPLFFLISGYFTMLMFQRKGLRNLLQQRVLRILIPCVIGALTLVPLNRFVVIHAMQAAQVQAQTNDRSLASAIGAGDQVSIEKWLASEDSSESLEQGDSRYGILPLHWAVLRGNLELVNRLLDRGANVNGPNRDGNRPLHAAAFLGYAEITGRLMARGADPRLTNGEGKQPWTATTLDLATTEFVMGMLELAPRDRVELERGRELVLEMMGPEQAEAARSFRESQSIGGDGQENLAQATERRNSWKQRYRQGLDSERWQVSFGGMTLQLFRTDLFAHLWFLWFLCWMVAGFALVAIPLQTLVSRVDPWLIAVGLMPLTMLPQALMGEHELQFGPDTASGLLPPPHLLIYYGLFFGFGVLAQQAEARGRELGRLAWITLPLGLVIVFPLWLFTFRDPFVSQLLQVLYVWSLSLGLIGLFRWGCSRELPGVRFLSDASYWLYLAHLPLVIQLQFWARDWPTGATTKFLGIVVVTTVLLLLSYVTLVRYTWLGWLLNGPRQRRSQATQATPRSGRVESS